MAVGAWGYAYNYFQSDNSSDVIVREPNLCSEWKCQSRNVLNPQCRVDLIDGRNTIGAVRVGDGGVLLVSVVAEQQHLLAVQGVFRPRDVRQRAGGIGTTRVVGVSMVDEVDESVRADVVTGETVEFREIADVKGAKVEQILPALPQE